MAEASAKSRSNNNKVAARPMHRELTLRTTLDDLEADKLISAEDSNALSTQSRNRDDALLHPISYIAKQNLQDLSREGQPLTSERMMEWLSEKSGQQIFHIDPLKIRAGVVTEVMSFQFAKRHQILCVAVDKESVTIATAQPWVTNWEADLQHVVRKQIHRVLAAPEDLKRYLVEFYSLAKSVNGATSSQFSGSGVGNFEQLIELNTMKDPEANDQHIINIVDWLFQYAFDQRASDIHVEPRREGGKIRFRIDGVLHQVYELPLHVMNAVTSRLKVLSRMNVAEKRKPQDGRIKTKRPNGSEVELRLSILPTAFGEKLVMRIFDPDVLLRSFSELGLTGEDYLRWKKLTTNPNGIILVTGPTGSGKTTTLYTSLKTLATPEVNVSTIEDPIEMVEDSFNQTQVQRNIDLDFAAGVRTLLRQDPDIIMVGEIRDKETGDMAVQAALTGHLVISTLHTNDAPTAITRLLDLGIPSYLIKSTVLGIMAQRLVRTLCPHCKDESSVDEEAWHQLVRPWKVSVPDYIYAPVGCLECRNTGYLGRQGIYEIMPFSENLKRFISDDTDISPLRTQAMREGMRTLRLSGAQKIAAGITTIEEVMRVAPPPESG